MRGARTGVNDGVEGLGVGTGSSDRRFNERRCQSEQIRSPAEWKKVEREGAKG